MDTPYANAGIGGPAPSPAGPGRLTVPAVVLQFFVFPLAVVAVCALIFVFVGWLTYESRGPADLLKEVTRPGAARETRFYSASQLARILEGRVRDAREQAGGSAPAALPADLEALAPAVLDAFRTPPVDDPDEFVRCYLARLLGLLRHRPAVPVLVEASGAAAPKFRIAILAALGDLGDAAAAPAALAALTHEDPALRKQAAFTLGQLVDARAVAPLQARLQDPVHDVRWNAALALTRFGGDPAAREAARPVLVQMLDRGYLEGIVARAAQEAPRANAVDRAWQDLWDGMAFSTEDYVAVAMVNAMRAVVRLKDRSFEGQLETISADATANPKVRDHAMQSLAVLRGR